MTTLILIMLWLITCFISAVMGFFIDHKGKPFFKAKMPPQSEKERKEAEIMRKDIENLYSYTGKERDINT